MNCQEIADRLSAYQDGALDPRMTERIRQHLDSCAGCRSELDAMNRLAEIAQSELSIIDPPESFAQAVMSRLPERTKHRVYRPVLVWSGVAAALLAVCLLLVNSRVPNPTVNRPVVAVNKPVINTPKAHSKQPAVVKQVSVHHGGQPSRTAPRPSTAYKPSAPVPRPSDGAPQKIAVRRDEPEYIANIEETAIRHQVSTSRVELARVPIGDDKPAKYGSVAARRDDSETRKSGVKLVARPQEGGFSIGLIVE